MATQHSWGSLRPPESRDSGRHAFEPAYQHNMEVPFGRVAGYHFTLTYPG